MTLHAITCPMHRLFPIVIALGTLVLVACSYDKEELFYPPVCVPGDPTAPGYWASTIEPIILSRCATCHSPGGEGPGDLRQYTVVKAIVDNGSFQQQVFVTRAMPQGGSLSECDLRKLQAWVDAGAPQ